MNECKKILLISKPRSGSTVFLNLLHSFCQINNVHNEPGISEGREIFDSLSIKDELLIKIMVSSEKGITNQFIKETNWDKIIILRRNDNDAILSMAHQYINNPLIFEDKKNKWRTNYKQQKDIRIPDFIPPLYKELELRFEEILGMNDNIIELIYESLYNKDRDIRRKELDNIVDTSEVHWLVLKNVLDKLDPKFKYTSVWNIPQDPIISNLI